MNTRSYIKARCLFVCALLLSAVWGRAANERLQHGMAISSSEFVVNVNGDCQRKTAITFNMGDYTKLKDAYPNSYQFLRNLSPDRVNYDVAEGAACSYDDARSAVRAEMVYRGFASKKTDTEWVIQCSRVLDYVSHAPSANGTEFYFYDISQLDALVSIRGKVKCTLPKEATEVRWDSGTHTIRYTMPPAKYMGNGQLVADFMVKNHTMTCPYKAYGSGRDIPDHLMTFPYRGLASGLESYSFDFAAQWVAKTVFRNQGRGILSDVAVRYRLVGFSEWSSSEKYPQMVPSQTIVSVYYPILDEKIGRLRTDTSCDLVMEYQYVDSEGKRREEAETKRIKLLGINSFVFSNLMGGQSFGSFEEVHSNAPLLAAWVSQNDPCVMEFAAMANKAAGGLGATTSDDHSIKVLEACYNMLLANDFTYQHPPGLSDPALKFDSKTIQNVKLPRDVIQYRSGTCIDLAILYASMANAVGLRPYLALTEGHCFPLVRLPQSGLLFAVEATGVGGGGASAASFADMVRAGGENLSAGRKCGRIVFIDIQELWARGITNPELDQQPANVLSLWGIKATSSSRVVPVAEVPVQPNPGPESPSSGGQALSPIPPIPEGCVFIRSFRPGRVGSPAMLGDAIIKALENREWTVVSRQDGLICGHIDHRDLRSTVYFRYENESKIDVYISGDHVPRWINYLEGDILENLGN